MRALEIFMHGLPAGSLCHLDDKSYEFRYLDTYRGPAVSRTLPVAQGAFHFDQFPPFFDGLLPEGMQLDQLLRQRKIDQSDKMSQLAAVGGDLVGAVSTRDSTP